MDNIDTPWSDTTHKITAQPQTPLLASDQALYVEVGIWHEFIQYAFQWMPTKVLSWYLKITDITTTLACSYLEMPGIV